MNISDVLADLGLRPNEIRFYLAALRRGTSRITDIAKTAGLLRTTSYDVIRSLVEKGFLSTVIKSGVVYVEATDPAQVSSLVEEKLAKFKTVLPELEQIKQTITQKPGVELYEGKEGLKTILHDIIATKKDFVAMANYEIIELLEFSFPQFTQKRVKAGIYARIIQQKIKPLSSRTDEEHKKELREMRFLPITFKSDVLVYGSNVAFVTTARGNPLGVIIRNREIAETQKQVFDLIWPLAKEIRKE